MVSLDQVAPPGGVTATWATHGGSATSGVDFKGRTGRLYFKAGQTTRYAQVKIIPDGAVEGDEQFTVQLSAVEGADIADGTGTVTILDEEGSSPSGISVGSSSVVEGQSGGSRYVWVPVTLAGKNAAAVTVHYATGGGTAVAPDDYLGHAGTLTFPPKAVVRWVLVYITADQVTEGNETLNVTLSSPIGGTIVHGTGTVTIVDDD
jgi:chitinase